MIIGTREFEEKNRTYVMGILNVTPDSFSDGGKWNRLDAALMHAQQMIAEGADLLDIGGESTRPGYTQISEDEEMHRVLPVIEQLKKNFDIPISIDTYKSSVAKAAAAAGADLINDIWGLKNDPAMADVIFRSGAACCLMHNQNRDLNQQTAASGQGFMQRLKDSLRETLRAAERAGIAKDKIILDPGVGFGKTYEENLEIIRCLEQLQELGYPVLLGVSRKSVIGNALDLPVEERLEGTLAATVLAVVKHCMFVRVHDVKENVRAIRMTEAVLSR